MRTLALCGGGIRGLLPAIWAKKLQYTHKSFDLIVGTSTGSIIGAAIASGKIEPAEIEHLYKEKGRRIFPGLFRKSLSRLGRTFTQGLSAPLYSNKALIHALKEEFGDMLFGEVKCKFMAVTYCYSTARPKVWKSWDPQDAATQLWKVVAASCSAPVYFPSMEINGLWYGDGGTTGANNPSLVAIAEASRLSVSLSDVYCTCLGTGQDIRVYKDTENYGPVQWAADVIHLMLEAPEQSVNYIAEQLIGDRFKLVNVAIASDHAAMDDARQSNLDYLTMLANSVKL